MKFQFRLNLVVVSVRCDGLPIKVNKAVCNNIIIFYSGNELRTCKERIVMEEKDIETNE